MARPERFELPTLWFEARCSIQLSYGRVPPSYQNLQAARRIAPFRSHGNERNCEGGIATRDIVSFYDESTFIRANVRTNLRKNKP